jgi:hypothetical protein
MYSNKNKDAGNYFLTLTATFSHPMFDPYSISVKMKISILKGNLKPPDFETPVQTMIEATAMKRTVIKLPKVKDVDLDSYKVLTFIEHPVKEFLKVLGDSEIVIMAKEDHEGNYTFGLALSDLNPNPLITVYTFNVTIKSQWPGRPKTSMTLNATATSMSNFGELVISFNNEVKIVPNYTN